MKKTTVITAKDVLHWQGEGFSGEEPPINELAQIIAEIVNGEYSIELAKQEIAEHQSSYGEQEKRWQSITDAVDELNS